MDEQRDEVYERIPWENLEEPGRDRQWVLLGIAAAVVAGALGYSFFANRPVTTPPLAEAPEAVAAPPSTVAMAPVAPPVVTSPSSTAPMLVAEADLYAVDPERLVDAASAHARWVVRELLSADGTDDGDSVLRSLLPADIPLPTVPEGTVVFVEWADSVQVEPVGPATFRVSVLVRYMVSANGETYQRLAPEIYTVDIDMATGTPLLLGAPRIEPALPTPVPALVLDAVPEAVLAKVEALRPGSQVIGGRVGVDGVWEVTILAPGPGGLVRPETLAVTP